MLKSDLRRAQLPLFAESDAPCARVDPATTRPPGQPHACITPLARKPQSQALWLCVYFPQLCLEAPGSPATSPAVVLSEGSGVTTVLACNDKAGHAGIVPSMSLNAALALYPALDTRARSETAETTLLHTRARRALAYTPIVSVAATGALLLEVGASLRLFGGLSALRKCLANDRELCGQHAVLATAPVARAALWLARSGQESDCTAQHALAGVLGRLPLACLDWPVTVQHLLLQMGIATLADCMRLPRDGFARRVGPVYLQELDQALGRYPELLRHYQLPEVFHGNLELGAESLVAEEIAGALQVLLTRLSAFLKQRQAGAQRLCVQLAHYARESTQLEVVLRQPCSSANYFLELLRLQLDRRRLPAPVTEVSLRVALVPMTHMTHLTHMSHMASGDLLSSAATAIAATTALQSSPAVAHVRAARLVERLRARLGPQHVYGIGLVAEHRPERAWRIAEAFGTGSPRAVRSEITSEVPGEIASEIPARARPLWLFDHPRRLTTRQGLPEYRGSLVFSGDAERIESGWWDGNDIRRDYYTVTGEQGSRYWIYRDCRDAGWYLHGLLG